MEVILKQDVDNLGLKGEVVRVAPGYARNFLFPKALAVAATEGNLKNLQHFIASAEKKQAAEREEAAKLAERLTATEIKIEAKAGEKNRLFGSITGQHIADAINAAMDLKLDKKKIAAGGGIKMLGKHKVMVTIYPGVTVEKDIEIVAAAVEEKPEKEEKPKKSKKAPAKSAKQEAAEADVAEDIEESAELTEESAEAEEAEAEETAGQEEKE